MDEKDVEKLYGHIQGKTKPGEDPGWDLYKQLTKSCSTCGVEGNDKGFVGLYNEKFAKVPFAWKNNQARMKTYKVLCKPCAKKYQEENKSTFTILQPPKAGQDALEWAFFNLLSVRVIYNKLTGGNLSASRLAQMYEDSEKQGQNGP